MSRRIAFILAGFGLFGIPQIASATTPMPAPDCLPPGPKGRIVVLAQLGGRGPMTPYRMPGSLYPAFVTAITGHRTDDVSLVLITKGDAIWDLSRLKQSRLKSVYVSGDGIQGVHGLSRSVPLRIRRWDDMSGNPRPYYTGRLECPPLRFETDPAILRNTVNTIKGLYGKWPTDIRYTHSTPTFDLDGGPVRQVGHVPTLKSVSPTDAAWSMPEGVDAEQWLEEQSLIETPPEYNGPLPKEDPPEGYDTPLIKGYQPAHIVLDENGNVQREEPAVNDNGVYKGAFEGFTLMPKIEPVATSKQASPPLERQDSGIWNQYARSLPIAKTLEIAKSLAWASAFCFMGVIASLIHGTRHGRSAPDRKDDPHDVDVANPVAQPHSATVQDEGHRP